MNTSIILALTLAVDCRIRSAGGNVQFAHDGKEFNNERREDTWHTFPAGTEFNVVAIVDKTDTYLLTCTEQITRKVKGEDGKEVAVTGPETYGLFLRRLSYEKLVASSRTAMGELEQAQAAAGNEVATTSTETSQVADEAALPDFTPLAEAASA